MTALRHALIVVLCYGVAVLATPFLLLLSQNAISLLPGGPSSSNPDGLLNYVVMGAMITGIYAGAPFLGAIALMRWWRRRDWSTHAAFGVLVAYVAMVLFDKPFWPSTQHAALLLAGFGAGLVYWFCRRPFGWVWA
jgi:hypothetical protein